MDVELNENGAIGAVFYGRKSQLDELARDSAVQKLKSRLINRYRGQARSYTKLSVRTPMLGAALVLDVMT